MTETCLEIRNLYKIFARSSDGAMQMLAAGADKEAVLAETGAVVGLNDVSISVPTGDIYMIMGLSGSGKSTLARCINRLNEPTAGEILLNGRDIVKLNATDLRDVRRTRISMVFQHFALLPNRRVIENVEFGLKLRGVSASARRKRAEEVLGIVGLTKWAYHYPRELSGGMRQRVGLARALATDADVLIMDEAFSALDPLIRTEMQDELLRLQRTLKKTIVFITHDFQEALKLGNRIAIMAEGRVVREGTPQSIVMDPRGDYVAAFTRDIDRSRVFDAKSVMSKPAATDTIGDHIFIDTAAGAIVTDRDSRILGTVTDADLQEIRSGTAISSIALKEFERIPADMKLIDIAGRFRSGRPMAVLDDDDRLIGTLDPELILRCIAPPVQVHSDVVEREKHV